MQASLIFPHQLYSKPAFSKNALICLIEDELYFSQYNFHKQKLVLHRASMKYYEAFLQSLGYKVSYQEATNKDPLEFTFKQLVKNGIKKITYVDTTDYLLERRIQRYAKKYKMELNKIESPNFFLSNEDFLQQLGKGKKYFMASFYIQQRKRLKLLLDEQEQPIGGQWSFDEANRKKLPKAITLPPEQKFRGNDFIKEAITYVNKHYANNYGSVQGFNYATTHEEAISTLKNFLDSRFEKFGDYEDAITKKESTLFHSVLTPALNIGLLSPSQIIDAVLAHHSKKEIPLNSLEGFIRQIIGWREFMRGVYTNEGVRERTTNYFNFTRKIPKAFWTGETGIEPIDVTIHKILKTGYCHHIERLMVLGNFMLLCEFDPHEVYRWFMEMFIDAYDWVMVPNVYGMSQYADGGFITTKPYVSGSNYILKMSDYTKGPWCEVWDALYWRFLYNNREIFKNNHRMSMMVNLVQKMDKDKLKKHLEVADAFLQKLQRA